MWFTMMVWASAATPDAELTRQLTALRDLTGDRVALEAVGPGASERLEPFLQQHTDIAVLAQAAPNAACVLALSVEVDGWSVELRRLAPSRCFPACSPGYLCQEERCIQSCNPACGAGWRCSAQRVCEPMGELIPPVAPAGVGEICVFRKKDSTRSSWTLSLDGISQGVVDADRYRCFPADAGTHRLVVAEIGQQAQVGPTFLPGIARVELQGGSTFTAETKVAPEETALLVCHLEWRTSSTEHISCATAPAIALPSLQREMKAQVP